jgi:hypothetical protein
LFFRWVSPEKTAAPPPAALSGDGGFIKDFSEKERFCEKKENKVKMNE